MDCKTKEQITKNSKFRMIKLKNGGATKSSILDDIDNDSLNSENEKEKQN